MSHSRDYSEGIASAIDDEVRRLIESAHDEAWDVLVQYRDVLDNLVLQLMEHETLARTQVLEIFASVQKRPSRGSYTGYGKRMPSDRPPVLTPKELALTAASDGKELPLGGNGQTPNLSKGGYPGAMPASMPDRFGLPGQYGNGGHEPEERGPDGTAR
jgi:cell division protease FtsH